MVSEAATKNEVPKALFLKSILYGGGIAIAFALFLQLFGISALKIMFGERYLSAFPLFLPVSIFITFVTLITIEMNYFLALGRNRFLVASLFIGFVAIYSLIWVYHQSISQMLYIISSVLAIVFLANGLYALLLKPLTGRTEA
jgi:O-antigen/teichoic acid export membrane protein